MAIKHSHVSLVCDMGSEELSVLRSDYNEIRFGMVDSDGDCHTVFVKDDEARQFAETIIKVLG